MRPLGPMPSNLMTLIICSICLFAQAFLGHATVSVADESATAPCNRFEGAWTTQERWVWRTLCNNEKADLRKQSAPRELTSSFLSTILLSEPYRSAFHTRIEITNAHFSEPIDLGDGVLANALLLDETQFDGPVYFQRAQLPGLSCAACRFNELLTLDEARVSGSIDLHNAWSHATVSLSKIHVNNSVILGRSTDQRGQYVGGGSRYKDIDASFARIGNNLELDDATTGSFRADGAEIAGSAFLRDAHFGRVDLGSAKIGHDLDFGGSTAEGLSLDGIEVKHYAFLNRSVNENGDYVGPVASFGAVQLISAHIGLALDLSGARTASIHANDAEVAGAVFLRDARSNDVSVRNAKIGGNLELIGSEIGALDLSGVEVKKSALLNRFQDENGRYIGAPPHFGTLNLEHAQIGLSLALTGATTKSINARFADITGVVSLVDGTYGDIDAYSARIGRLDIIRATAGAVWAESSEIKSDLQVRDSSLASLDLTAARIGGDFFLVSDNDGTFGKKGRLILRNVSVNAIEDCPTEKGCRDPWPRGCNPASPDCVAIDVTGFTYRTLGVLSRRSPAGASRGGERDDLADIGHRDVSWWAKWLRRGPFSPQPYDQLASVLRQQGRPDAATRLQFESKNRELWSSSFPWKGFLALELLLVGYGFYPWFAGVWAVVFLAIGVSVYLANRDRTVAKEQEGRSWLRGEPTFITALIYSFDTLIPLVKLRKSDDDLEFGKAFPRYYFYCHRIVGWILATFLVAAVSGITK
jgi:hypothetical protein